MVTPVTLLGAHIQQWGDTSANWSSKNPILLKNEIGIVEGTNPIQFKIGNGTSTWSQLGWGNVTALAQLAEDSNHKLVSDIQIANWSSKEDAIYFDYDSSNPNETNARIVAFVDDWIDGGRRCQIYIDNIDAEFSGDSNNITSNGRWHFDSHAGDTLTGHIDNVFHETEDGGYSHMLYRIVVTFSRASGGSMTVTKKLIMPKVADAGVVSHYEIEKVTTESGFASTYKLKVSSGMGEGTYKGAPINIPLDQVLKNSSIKEVTTVNTPYTGAKVGDKYIDFMFQNTSTHQYLPVKDLVDVYTPGTYIEVSASNVISLNYASLKSKLQTDFNSVYDSKGAGTVAAKKAVDELTSSIFIIKCGTTI